MADASGGSPVCNDRCGCPTPCPGGLGCGCRSSESTLTGEEHRKCSCGEHCGCNPCTCGRNVELSGTGKAVCRCGQGCSCDACAS
ncbi:putative EC protein III [Tripterygium wilfordii]|uniref:Putative EC protein III n=1 Tax=Tripterygium wilfordii TaxID=458696 RepID=A0A7J7DXM0_TRIWF|nr:EC protein III-like [Tripterygium wilfordii]KAF5751001.1 putative EC protein III [Tripterygium wilfordii]